MRPFGSRRSLWGVRRHLFAPAPSCRASLLSVFHPFPAVASLPAASGLRRASALRPDRLRVAVLGTCGVASGVRLVATCPAKPGLFAAFPRRPCVEITQRQLACQEQVVKKQLTRYKKITPHLVARYGASPGPAEKRRRGERSCRAETGRTLNGAGEMKGAVGTQ